MQRNLVLGPVIGFDGAWRLVCGDLLGVLERAAVLKIGGDAGGAESARTMSTNCRLYQPYQLAKISRLISSLPAKCR
jgi:hypothetical protein